MRVAILGAGKVGTAIARVALHVGHEVRIAGSGAPEAITLLVDVVAPGATAHSAKDAVHNADVVILSIPSPRYISVDRRLLKGKVVLDATNYWPATDGFVPEFVNTGSSEVIAEHLAGARVVKTLNHITYHELETHARPGDSGERRALAVVADDPDAAATVAEFVDSIGFDPVVDLPLSRGRLLQPDTDIFSSAMTRTDLARALDHNQVTQQNGTTND